MCISEEFFGTLKTGYTVRIAEKGGFLGIVYATVIEK
jgi:hypothetical protein